MGLVSLVLNVACAGIDLISFFVIVRLIVNNWSVNWLVPLDNIARRLVDSFADAVEKLRRKISMTTLTHQGRLIWGLVALMVLRIVIASFAGLR